MEKDALYFWVGLGVACILAGVSLMVTIRGFIGKALLLLGLVIAVISTIQFVGQSIPALSWTSAAIWGIVFTFTVIGFVLAKLFYPGNKRLEPEKIPTSVKYTFRGGPYAPDMISPSVNIVSPIRNVTINATKIDPLTSALIVTQDAFIIFLVFERPILYEKIRIEFSRDELPYRIEAQTPRYAIVMILGEIPAETVSIYME
jgi:hypothetical protein